MPKGKRRNRNEKNRGESSSDDESINDNASVISGQSECRSNADDGENGEMDEQSQQEIFEEKLIEAIDGLIQKSAQARTQCFDAVCTAFIKKYVPEFAQDRRITLCDAIEKGLRRGRGAEQVSAAKLSSLLCVQVGVTSSGEEVCNILRPVLELVANDHSFTPLVRGKSCIALGLLMFLSGGELGDVIQVMKQLELLFNGSYLRGDGTIQSAISADVGGLHAMALSAWSLLLTLLSPADVYQFMNECDNSFAPSLIQLSEMLLSPHLDVRMSAGEALAIAYELGREYNEDFGEDFANDLVESLRQLATDSHKYRAKKDRKTQRATFRDVLRSIEEFERYEDNIRVGGRELLILDGWIRHKQYDALCSVLGPGLQVHLINNDLLRDIFNMGAKPLTLSKTIAASKQSKLERHLMNAAAFKARTITRGKNRDKRSAVV